MTKKRRTYEPRVFDGRLMLGGVGAASPMSPPPSFRTRNGYPAATLDRSVRQPHYWTNGKLGYLVADDRNQYPAEVELTGNSAKRMVTLRQVS